MRSVQRAVTVLGAGTAILAATATAVQADSSELANPLINDETGGHYALYNSEWIDMSQGWQGAEICVEQEDTSMVCYADEVDYLLGEDLSTDQAATFAKSDCVSAYLCLWDDRQYSGAKIDFRSAGYKYLWDYGFSERANSYYNHRDTTSGLFDNRNSSGAFTLEAGRNGSHPELSTLRTGRGGDGSWNNKIDTLCLTTDGNCP